MAQPMVEARQVNRLQYAIGAVANEFNRPWAGSRQAYVLFDPILEQAIGIDGRTSQYVPELATRWEPNDDLSEWRLRTWTAPPCGSATGAGRCSTGSGPTSLSTSPWSMA